MVVDALNAYFRAYIVDPSLSENGQPIGGYKDILETVARYNQERLKQQGDWVCLAGIRK